MSNWVEQGAQVNLLKLEPELGELCWSLKLKGNLNIFKKLFQLNTDKVLTCSFKCFKLTEAVLLSWAQDDPESSFLFELQARIGVVWWVGWVTQAVGLLSIFHPQTSFLMLGKLSVHIVIYNTPQHIYVSAGSLSETLSNLLVENYSVPQSFSVLLSHLYLQRRLLSVKGRNKSWSGLLISHGPDGLGEVARNNHKIIFHFCALNSPHTKLCKLPVALRSWNINWNLLGYAI